MTQSATRRATMLLALSLLIVPTPAFADLFLAPFAGVKFGGGTSIFDLELAASHAKTTIGASAFELSDDILGYEVTFGYIPLYFKSDKELPLIKPGSYVVDLVGNVIVSLPPDVTAGGLRPYVVGGVGLIHAESADILNILQVRRTVPAFNAGVGAIGLITNNVGVRFDFRYLRSMTNDDGTLSHVGRRISYSRATIGLVLRF
jgi:opacity protein-like surface antigen